MTARNDFRRDIQFLRGIAVLLVVLFHAFEDVVPHGFLGVDVFFVISGFLVTSMIVRDLDDGRFTLSSFYFHRVRRIVPAAFSTLIGTTLAAYWVLTSYEWSDFLRQLTACVFFSANLLQSTGDGYFARTPETEPLRHFWSLALEEQFYLVIPVLMMIVPARWRLRCMVALAGMSLLLCIVGASARPTFTFYNLPTRAWELLAGAICSAAAVRGRYQSPAWTCWAALGALVATSIMGVDGVHPRGDAIIVVAATCLILLSRDNWLPERPTAPVRKIGDWSYSLYLVHWPIISFAYLASGERPRPFILIGALLLSLALAVLQFRFVELPFWRNWPIGSRRRWWQLAAMAASLGVISIPAVGTVLRGEGRIQAAVLNPRTGLAGCDRQAFTGLDPDHCRTGERPLVALWGDSYALHLVDGILADPVLKHQLLQVTSRGCAPVLGYSPIWRNLANSAACIPFNERAIALLASGPERVVVVSSPYSDVLGEDAGKVYHDGKVVAWDPGMASGLTQALQRLRTAGKTVVIVGPTPREGFDAARCNLQRSEGRIWLGRRRDCRVHFANLAPGNRQALAALPGIARATRSWLLMPADALCSQGSCSTKIGDKLIYRDRGHLTEFGSKYVVSRMGLNSLLRRLIREGDAPPPLR